MLLKNVVETCDKMGQLGVAQEVYLDQWCYTEDPVSARVAFCCNLLLKRLYQIFAKGAEPSEIVDWHDEVTLPVPEISFEMFCHGVLAEYFFQTQDYACFDLWNARFEAELEDIRLKTGGGVLPVGRWI